MAKKFPYTLEHLKANVVLDYFHLKYLPLPTTERLAEAREEYKFIFGKEFPNTGTQEEQYFAILNEFTNAGSAYFKKN